MEEIGFVKDEKPYIIFKCEKCGRYLYVKKEGQKGKKCPMPRCGRSHAVINIKIEEIVLGHTAAVDTVKAMQNEMASQEFGGISSFRTNNDFIVPSKNLITIKKPTKKKASRKEEVDYKSVFYQMIKEIRKSYETVPDYVLRIKAKVYSIPINELKIALKDGVRNKFIIPEKKNYFKIMIS